LGLTKYQNPIFFPILNEGEVLILKDGYYARYNDNSGGFTNDTSYPTKSLTPLKSGEKYKVTGVERRMSGVFQYKTYLETSIGDFNSESIFDEYTPTKEVRSLLHTTLVSIGHIPYFFVIMGLLSIIGVIGVISTIL